MISHMIFISEFRRAVLVVMIMLKTTLFAEKYSQIDEWKAQEYDSRLQNMSQTIFGEL
jgi:hypothetical protein